MLAKERHRLVAPPPVPTLEQVELESIPYPGGLINALDLVIAAHRRLHLEALVVRADLDEQRLGCDQPLKVRHVAQLVQTRCDLAAAEVDVAHSEVGEAVAV